jgi:hypothetical protein
MMNYTVSIRNEKPRHFAERRAAMETAIAYHSIGRDVFVIDNTDPAGGTDHARGWATYVNRNIGKLHYCHPCGGYTAEHARGGHR